MTNPGAVVYRGEVIGIWTIKKKAKGMDIKITLWTDASGKAPLQNLAEKYAAFRQQALINLEIGRL